MTTIPLSQVPLHEPVTLLSVGGKRAFRRRLMELGLVPGTTIEIVNVAPMGDPLELVVRGCRLSIRKAEAAQLVVQELDQAVAARAAAK